MEKIENALKVLFEMSATDYVRARTILMSIPKEKLSPIPLSMYLELEDDDSRTLAEELMLNHFKEDIPIKALIMCLKSHKKSIRDEAYGLALLVPKYQLKFDMLLSLFGHEDKMVSEISCVLLLKHFTKSLTFSMLENMYERGGHHVKEAVQRVMLTHYDQLLTQKQLIECIHSPFASVKNKAAAMLEEIPPEKLNLTIFYSFYDSLWGDQKEYVRLQIRRIEANVRNESEEFIGKYLSE